MAILHFVGGKGGVGKTTCAAAMAVARAEAGARVLVLSTDPAHSLGDALRVRLGAKPTAVAAVRGPLYALELDADRVLATWLKTHHKVLAAIGERGTYLDRADVERFMDLSIPGVSELLALGEIVRLTGAGRYDGTVVDTAPTGHTLRLFETPDALARLAAVLDDLQSKHRVIVEAVNRRYRGDEADALIASLAGDARRIGALLRDRSRSRFSWVTLPEPLAIAESRRALAALAAAGITVETLIVNRASGSAAARTVPPDLRRGRTVRLVPLLDKEPVGIAALREVGEIVAGRASESRPRSIRQRRRVAGAPRERPPSTVAALVASPPRLIFSMGKGGVGKTTCAAALAIAIARGHRGRRVLLLSIDPAHSVGDVLRQPIGNETVPVKGVARLHARELDAQAEFERARGAYHAAVDELFDRLRGDSRFDATYDRQAARDLIELAPPGLDELFALITIVNLSSGSPYDCVVVDTAPTGHALRLFEMREQAREWVRTLMSVLLKYGPVLHPGALASELVAMSKGLRHLDALLGDRRGAAVVAVTRPGMLPRLETIDLVRALGRLHIAAPAFVVANAADRAADRAELARLRAALKGCAIILAPAAAPPPRGGTALARWMDRWVQL